MDGDHDDDRRDRLAEAEATAVDTWCRLRCSDRIAVHHDPRRGYLYRPGEVIVDAERDANGQAARALEERGGRPRAWSEQDEEVLAPLGLVRWDLPLTADVPGLVAELRRRLDRDAPVDRPVASPNHVLPAAQFWKFGPAEAPVRVDPQEVRPQRRGLGTGEGVTVAVLDSGYVPTRKQPLLARYTDDGDDGDPLVHTSSGQILSLFGGHGNLAAGMVLQEAPAALVDPEATLDVAGVADDVEVARDLLLVRRSHRVLHLVNLSLGGPSADDRPPPFTAAAVRQLRRDEVVVVAAAGNDGRTRPWYPAALWAAGEEYDHVVSVAAVDERGAAAAFTNRGRWVRACAVGVDVLSTYVRGRLLTPAGPVDYEEAARCSGTSFAAPRVAGIIAASMTEGGSMRAALEVARELCDPSRPAGPPGCGVRIG